MLTRVQSLLVGSMTIVAILGGCVTPTRSTEPAPSAASGQPIPPKRIVAAIRGNPSAVHPIVGATGPVSGGEALGALAHVGLGALDMRGQLHPQLAEAMPSAENGLWVVFPDGRMQTTWRLREHILWHDGVPLTADDFLFTFSVEQDPDMALFRSLLNRSVEEVVAPDPRTLVVRWKAPNVLADNMWSWISSRSFLPLPRHLLEREYRDNKANFDQLSYWSADFIGAGPFRLREWVASSHAIYQANDAYVLGRPKIDEIEVRFISDVGTLTANILAGEVELTLGGGRTFSVEQALTIGQQSQAVRVELSPSAWIAIYPQFLNPSPPLVAEARFRRALLHALNRQEMVDSLYAGQTRIAHSYLGPDSAEFEEVQPQIARYEYDPRQAAQLIEDLGYQRGADGLYRDPRGQRDAFELRTTQAGVQEAAMLATASAWQSFGLAVQPFVVPAQRVNDAEFRSNYAALELVRYPNDTRSMQRAFLSGEAPVAENNYTGGNRARYQSAELDALIDRFHTTIPRAQRTQFAVEINRHISENLNVMGLFYDLDAALIGARLRNVMGKGTASTQVWNVHEWDVD
ncbi:MAG: hypothetical protein HW416_431 [Chloroflexi bacterium]|nr:hypothetical protein [Chloroflexota bacterium]